jgi:hypothetical protein
LFVNASVDICRALKTEGYVLVQAKDLDLDEEAGESFKSLSAEWQDLPPDLYLKDQEPYRRRRFGSYRYSTASDELTALKHEPFYQSAEYNKFAGGISRHFQPLTPQGYGNAFLKELIKFNVMKLRIEGGRSEKWKVGVHQIRIISNSRFVGNPTPEGIHRDGVAYFSVHLIARENIGRGGVTCIYTPGGDKIDELTLSNPLDSLYANDCSILHCVSEIHPADGAEFAFRDALIMTYE